MILRRISQSIKDQDWFVVGVEIMIVVVGIFIGLQVDDWNETRKDLKLEREYLERLRVEIDNQLEAEQGRLRWNQARIAQAELILSVLESRFLAEEDKKNFEYGLYLLGVINRSRLSWGVVDELRNTGNIQLLRNLNLRAALTDTENHFRWFNQIVEEEAFIVRSHRAELTKHYRILRRTRSEELRGVDDVRLQYDLEDFWSNEQLLNSIYKLAEYQGFADSVLRDTIEQLTELRDLVTEVLHEQYGEGA